ncbi:MAG: glycoside hydrolase family 13 protein [Ruminococcaceae bacterium]|nr:glycoside hydrolase family 13 protein [Oscillospiraceae bacterium]
MLPKKPLRCALPTVQKTVNGKDVSALGAFAATDTLTLTVRAPRALGAAGVVLRIAPDGLSQEGEERDLPLSFIATANGTDTYRLTLPLSDLGIGETGGLFYYEYLFLRGADTLFTCTADNVTFTLESRSCGRFRLLVTEPSQRTPAWFRGRTMYHIFVDRFAPGKGERRPDAVYHERWNEEIEQFGAYPGAPVKNNEFFGGTLWGIIDKLDYLQSLGIGVLYLSPIFKAASNHKYDTGDYETVEPQFGGEEALRALLAACKERDMGVILDGVFNHTGSDSRYFNMEGSYETVGAYQSRKSPYANWFYFKKFPDKYECWWDIKILPKLKLANPETHNYFVGEGGIIERYTRMGVAGWRLDVVDEVPDPFLDELCARVAAETDGEGVVIGEVWENAADKIAYGKRRRYFRGRQLHGVMNYPMRNGVISFVREGDAAALCRALREIWGSYPPSVSHSLMNLLSTHDTERILTVLGGAPDDGSRSNAELRVARLTPTERQLAVKRLKMASAIQFTVFGVPSVFYGDEAGLEGYHDPFCRRPYPWGQEDQTLLAHYRKLGQIRAGNPVLADGDFAILREEANAVVYERKGEKGHLIVAANRGETTLAVTLPGNATELLSGRRCNKRVTVLPDDVKIWRIV